MTRLSKEKESDHSLSKTTSKNTDEISNQCGTIPEVVSQKFTRLKKNLKAIDQKYDQSIDALNRWAKEEKAKLDEHQKKSREKFSCQVIDASDINYEIAIKNMEKAAAKLNEEQRQKDKKLQDRIDSILKKGE